MANKSRVPGVLKHAWSIFNPREPTPEPIKQQPFGDLGYTTAYRPDRNMHVSITNEKSIIASLYTRMAMDVANMQFKHIRTNDEGDYIETLNTGLNNCLSLEANRDQTGRELIQDIMQSLFDEGVVAVVPTKTDLSPLYTGGFDIRALRVGRIINWRPTEVEVRLYDEDTGIYKDVWLPKSIVAILQNPLYDVMNEYNSTLQRLVRKLFLLDAVDEQSGSGKLDLIIQLPYTIRSEARRNQAKQRVKDIEGQLAGSKYGVAYADGTEKVIQLNRPAENNLMAQVEYLTSMLYSQLGMTEKVADGTADEQETLNYLNRTIGPLCNCLVESSSRKFLSKTARTQNQTIRYFRDMFSMMPADKFAETVDKYSRNEIMSPNEFRAILGLKPNKDPKSDELRNRNISASKDSGETEETIKVEEETKGDK